jgi:hypothetical protein
MSQAYETPPNFGTFRKTKIRHTEKPVINPVATEKIKSLLVKLTKAFNGLSKLCLLSPLATPTRLLRSVKIVDSVCGDEILYRKPTMQSHNFDGAIRHSLLSPDYPVLHPALISFPHYISSFRLSWM